MSLARLLVRATAAGVALAVVAASARAQHDLTTLPLDDPAYEQLDALSRAGCVYGRPSPFRPYLVGDVRQALASSAGDDRCAGVVREALATRFLPENGAAGATAADSPSGLRLGGVVEARATAVGEREFRPLFAGTRPDSLGDPAFVGRARARVVWDGGASVAAVLEGYAQTDRRNDPTLRGRGFRQTEGVVDISEAYIVARTGPLAVLLGRGWEAWLGDGRESMALSAIGPPMDRLALRARWSRFEARGMFASIDDVVLTDADGLASGTPPQRVHRFLAAHALTARITPSWEVTLGETALLARRGGGVDLAFVNPVTIYVVAENDSSRAGDASDENNLTAFAATRLVRGRAAFEGELVIDDIQIDARDRENLPHQLAWRLATTLALPLARPTSVGLDYRRVGSYTYLRDLYAHVYQQYDVPIGSELGPDSDMLRASGELWPNGRMRLSAGIARWRQGAQRIFDRPSEGAFGHAGEPFPSLTPERPAPMRAWIAQAGLALLDTRFTLRLTGELASIENVDHQPSLSATPLRAHVSATYRFRYP
ncbi:MAG TPA: hypothetical protein VK922_16700 [Gemmatimonadaceae bacterium]|nr:hypothetical protein [Gemmatimonadaceae bacterium]